MFYVGDGSPPEDLKGSGYKVFARGELLAGSDDLLDTDEVVLDTPTGLNKNLLHYVLSRQHTNCVSEYRDVCAIVDFQVNLCTIYRA